MFDILETYEEQVAPVLWFRGRHACCYVNALWLDILDLLHPVN